MGTTSDTTAWSVSVDTSGSAPVAALSVSVNGAAAQPFSLQGVCYSPTPINGSSGLGPALGDWFWDSFSGTGYDITGWEALWNRDLPNLQALGANTIKVYCMLSRQLSTDSSAPYPVPWNSGQLFTHESFLDLCWNGGVNPTYVLVCIPLPQEMFWLSDYVATPPAELSYWTNVLDETVQQIADHPAVLGFIIQNEMDSNLVTYPNTSSSNPTPTNLDAVAFWWAQVEYMAFIAKTAAPTKLVGMSVHDDPNICGLAQSYMAACPSLDFWGVNTYQTISWQSIFDADPTLGATYCGYNGLTGAALKPVIITEFGVPATGHQKSSDPSTIYSDAATQQAAATVIGNMLPQAYGSPPPAPVPAYQSGVCIGLYYFEYCDEWWNQGGAPNIYTWYGGSASSGFPNGYWDQDGFGIYQASRGGTLANDAPTWVQNGGTDGPNTPIDIETIRQPVATAVQTAFSNAANAFAGNSLAGLVISPVGEPDAAAV